MTTIKIGKYMSAEPVGTAPESYLLRSSKGAALGLIEWYRPWRQYVVNPESTAVFSADCLRDLASFCEERKS